VGTTDVNLVEMGDATIARGDGDIAQLDVHVVFGFDELSAEDLARRELERTDVALWCFFFPSC